MSTVLKFVNGQLINVPASDAFLGIIFTMDPTSPAEQEARERFYGSKGSPERTRDDEFRRKRGIQ
jgi:hypothetical protein